MTLNTQIRSSVYLKREICNDIEVCSIERKQLDLCKRNIIFCHVDCFCLQERKSNMKPEVSSVYNISATASAKIETTERVSHTCCFKAFL